MEWPIEIIIFFEIGWIHGIVVTAFSALTQAHKLPLSCEESQSNTE